MKKKITIAGMVLIILMALVVVGVVGEDNSGTTEEPYVFVTEWGAKGYGDGQFGGVVIAQGSTFIITDKTLEALKNVITDEQLKNIFHLKTKEFNNINDFYYTLEKLNFNADDCWVIMKAAALKKAMTDSIGPLFIAVDKFNNIYVSDRDKAQIQKFDSEGNFLTKWGRCGSGKGQFSKLSGIAVDSECYVYVVDQGNCRIQKFDSEGKFQIKWGAYGAFGGQFVSPTAIAISPDNYVYVNNNGINIQKFNFQGDFIELWEPTWNPLASHSNKSTLGRLDRSIAVDSKDNLFMLTFEYSDDNMLYSNLLYPYIRKYNLIESPEKLKGVKIWGEGKCDGTVDLTLDSHGNIFAVNSKDSCVYKIDSNGNLLAQWGSFGSAPGQFNNPESIAVDQEGNVYVMDTGNYRIQKFAQNPNYKENN